MRNKKLRITFSIICIKLKYIINQGILPFLLFLALVFNVLNAYFNQLKLISYNLDLSVYRVNRLEMTRSWQVSSSTIFQEYVLNNVIKIFFILLKKAP